MKVKVTKSQIIKELNSKKYAQLDSLRTNHSTQRNAYKLNVIREKYGAEIKALVEEASPVLEKWEKLQETLRTDTDLKYKYFSGNYTFEKKFTSEDLALNFIENGCYFEYGEYSKFSNLLSKQYCAIEEEWNKLIAYLKSLPLAQIKEYLVENKIELDCMKAKEETRLVRQDINLKLLWGDNNGSDK